MHLNPGRLKEIVDGNREEESALTCHQTLPYYPGDTESAICRGYFDRFKYDSTPLRMAVALDMIVEEQPPPENKEQDA